MEIVGGGNRLTGLAEGLFAQAVSLGGKGDEVDTCSSREKASCDLGDPEDDN